jgi:hypothetical protein
MRTQKKKKRKKKHEIVAAQSIPLETTLVVGGFLI